MCVCKAYTDICIGKINNHFLLNEQLLITDFNF